MAKNPSLPVSFRRGTPHAAAVAWPWREAVDASLQRAARRRTTLAAALFLIMLALSGQYLLYFALLLTPLYVAGYV